MKKLLLGFILAFSFIFSYSQTASIDANNITARNRLRIPVKDTTGTAYCGELRMRMVAGDTALYIFNCRAVGKKRWDKYVTGFNVLDNRGNLDTILVYASNDTIGVKSIRIVAGNNISVTPTITDSTILFTVNLPSTITPVSGADFEINGVEYVNSVRLNKVDSNFIDANKTIINSSFSLSSSQSISVGSATTLSSNIAMVEIDPASVLASHTITMPASPTDNQMIYIMAGGTIAVGSPVVTSFSIVGNSGQSMFGTIPSTLTSGDVILLWWRDGQAKWKRIRL